MRVFSFFEAICEAEVFPLDGVDYLIDPSLNQIVGLIRRSERRIARGIVTDQGQFFVWDAYARTHDDSERALRRAGLIPGPVIEVVIGERLIMAYQSRESMDPTQVPGEVFQMFLQRALRQGWKMPGHHEDPTRINLTQPGTPDSIPG